MVDPASIRTRDDFRAALEKLYSAAGLSYQKLAERTGVAHNTIHGWVSGDTVPRWSGLELVLKEWGVTDTRLLQPWKQARDRAEADAADRLGWSLAEVTDPFMLEVHRPITADGAHDLPVLPPYVRRAHDERLKAIVCGATEGKSAIAVLLAGSSTGKTRALWEALAPLRGQAGWRIWHPRYPTRQQELRDGLQRGRPRTVLWLNETQRYFEGQSADERERTANLLQELLADPRRAPVLVLGSLWHEHYENLCGDPSSAARKVLGEAIVKVPAAFTGADLDAMRREAAGQDPRLALACERATDGRITQYLAGGPELIDRYEHQVSAAARVVIEVAMDVVRFGHRNVVPHALLHDAAAACMSDDIWDGLADNWFESVLAETSEDCKGARGPITRIRDRPLPSRAGRRTRPPANGAAPALPVYELADYLDQYGRRERVDWIPPVGFWEAVATHAHPDDQFALAHFAWARGMYRDAAQLWKNATGHGNITAAVDLVRYVGRVLPGSQGLAEWTVVTPVDLDNPSTVAGLLETLRQVGAVDQVQALVARDPASQVTLHDTQGVAWLLKTLREVGAEDQVQALLARDPASHITLDRPYVVARLLKTLQEVGAEDQVQALLARDPASHITLDRPYVVARLLKTLQEVGAEDQVQALLARDPASHITLHDARGVAWLLKTLREVGAEDQVQALLTRDFVSHVVLDDQDMVVRLLGALRKVGAQDHVRAPLADLASHAAVDDPQGVAWLLGVLWGLGAEDQVQTLTTRAATRVVLDDPQGLAWLLEALREVNAVDQVQALLARDPASHVTLHDAQGVARLLEALREVNAVDQVQALLARDPASHVTLDRHVAARILRALREIGAEDQVQTLLHRLPALGLFDIFVDSVPGGAQRFRFGREPNDGTPTAAWGWDDLA